MKRRLLGMLLIMCSILIVSVSAFVYESTSNTVTQTIVEIATITLDQGTLGSISEGQTILYTPTNTSVLDGILTITTQQDNVYLHFDTDLEGQDSNYDIYQIEVIADTVQGSTIGVDDVIVTLTTDTPDTSAGINLDTTGDWAFDFQITTAAGTVDSDTPTTVNVTVTAESTST